MGYFLDVGDCQLTIEMHKRVATYLWENAVSVVSLANGKLLYRGHWSEEESDIDFDFFSTRANTGIWLSESIGTAKEYCYLTGGVGARRRTLFELRLINSIRVIQFPSDHHLGTQLQKEGVVPAHQGEFFPHLNWNAIVDQLCRLDEAFTGVIGYGSIQRNHTRLSELWVSDPRLFKEISRVSVPHSKREFLRIYGDTDEKILDRYMTIRKRKLK